MKYTSDIIQEEQTAIQLRSAIIRFFEYRFDSHKLTILTRRRTDGCDYIVVSNDQINESLWNQLKAFEHGFVYGLSINGES